ncbi:hypothetical protein V8G54_031942 [Vigna mungo]|uniref:Uncharacterized protein n=1 Tax=Vigna mungo TaxID=3915 RepID=A0AAQ3ML36_VIGMU
MKSMDATVIRMIISHVPLPYYVTFQAQIMYWFPKCRWFRRKIERNRNFMYYEQYPKPYPILETKLQTLYHCRIYNIDNMKLMLRFQGTAQICFRCLIRDPQEFIIFA